MINSKFQMAVVMNSLSAIDPKKDSTIALLLEGQKRQWDIFVIEPHHLIQKKEGVAGILQKVKLIDDSRHWYEIVARENRLLKDLDLVWLRTDPPVDRDYLYNTYLLEQALNEGANVLNDPKSIRDCNEKLFASQFNCCPDYLVTSQVELVISFLEKYHQIVIKDLDSLAGRSVFLLSEGDPNTNVIIENVTLRGRRLVIVQPFLSDVMSKGDKRILMICGEPYPYGLVRIPKKGELRGNLAAGAMPLVETLSKRDEEICQEIGPILKEKKLWFVGLDIIDGLCTEINVTSPTGIREIDSLAQVNVSAKLLDEILERSF